MTEVIIMLFAFVALGLLSRRLGWATYAIMSAVILTYVIYAFNK